VHDAERRAAPAYRTCEYAVLDVTPDGRGVLVTDPAADLFHERYPYLAVIDMATGARTASLAVAEGDAVGGFAWEGAEDLDVALFSGRAATWNVSRLDISDSSLTSVLPALPGTLDQPSYEISGQCFLGEEGR
jgi:hypothetical protein